MRVDFHLHLFDTPDFVDEQLRAMDAADVACTVLQPLPPFRFKGCICMGNEDVLRAAKAHPDRLIGSIYLDPRDPHWRDTLERYHGEGFRCVKMFPPVGFYPDEPQFLQVFDEINHVGLPVLCHVGLTGLGPTTSSKHARPIYLDALLRRFPETRFVMAHWGGLGTWAEAWALMKANPNVFLDTSGIRWAWPGAELYRLHAACTPIDFGRLLWGTDNLDPPAESIRQNLAILRDLGQESLADAVLGGTAARVLKLSPEA